MNINVQINRVIVPSTALVGGFDWQQQELLRRSMLEEIHHQLSQLESPERMNLIAVDHNPIATADAAGVGRSIASAVFGVPGTESRTPQGLNGGSAIHAVE